MSLPLRACRQKKSNANSLLNLQGTPGFKHKLNGHSSFYITVVGQGSGTIAVNQAWHFLWWMLPGPIIRWVGPRIGLCFPYLAKHYTVPMVCCFGDWVHWWHLSCDQLYSTFHRNCQRNQVWMWLDHMQKIVVSTWCLTVATVGRESCWQHYHTFPKSTLQWGWVSLMFLTSIRKWCS